MFLVFIPSIVFLIDVQIAFANGPSSSAACLFHIHIQLFQIRWILLRQPLIVHHLDILISIRWTVCRNLNGHFHPSQIAQLDKQSVPR